MDAELGRIKLVHRTAEKKVLQIMIRETTFKMFLRSVLVTSDDADKSPGRVKLNIDKLVLEFIEP
jgi:hypothetical protein